MKKLKFAFLLALLPALLWLAACGGAANEQAANTDSATLQLNETEMLLQYLDKSGDFINSPDVPALIKATEVFENIGNPLYLYIDLRKQEDYLAGHVNGALNVGQADLLAYFNTDCQPGSYNKIVLICYSGQQAAFATGLLRMMGYANVYAMKWGMSAWNAKLAEDKWTKNLSSHLADKLDTVTYPKAPKGELPQLNTGKKTGLEILEVRAARLLKTAFKDVSRKLDDYQADPSKYYLVNYWPADKYQAGHLPNATQYTPKKSFSPTADLATLPTSKPILVYCFTGQHAAFAAAYLQVLGYDAYTMVYGANAFMHSTMVAGGDPWSPFTKAEIQNYPLVVGAEPTDGKIAAPKAPVKEASPEAKAQGGGC